MPGFLIGGHIFLLMQRNGLVPHYITYITLCTHRQTRNAYARTHVRSTYVYTHTHTHTHTHNTCLLTDKENLDQSSNSSVAGSGFGTPNTKLVRLRKLHDNCASN